MPRNIGRQSVKFLYLTDQYIKSWTERGNKKDFSVFGSAVA